MSKLAPPKFVKCSDISPESDGYNVIVKIVRECFIIDVERSDKTRVKISEIIVGDETASIVMTLKDDQVNTFRPGEIIEVRNAKVEMIHLKQDDSQQRPPQQRPPNAKDHSSSFMRLVVDKWGKIRKIDNYQNIEVNTSKNLSSVEYELVIPTQPNK
eukprot:TRINITY_DN3125_c0_g2_i1.p1 TRINITY_DN3125_c0_g2~~TRINITY_DN3125_c0_g2_i1.p1  ORF type:complete len:157 (-),score=25.06 TRINITY_DN3125_c0_g2_i1:11-481(-)